METRRSRSSPCAVAYLASSVRSSLRRRRRFGGDPREDLREGKADEIGFAAAHDLGEGRIGRLNAVVRANDDDARGGGADDALLVLLQRPDLLQPLCQGAVEARVLVGEARLRHHGGEQALVLGGERNTAVLVPDPERPGETAAAPHREERPVAHRMETPRRRRLFRPEGRAAQVPDVLVGEAFGEQVRVGVAVALVVVLVEQEERAGDDVQALLDAAGDRLHELLAGARRGEVTRDVEQGAAGAVRVVVLDLLEDVGDALLDGDQERREHDAGPERDHVLPGFRHPLQGPIEQGVEQDEGHPAEQHGRRRAQRLAHEQLDVPEPPLQDRVGESEGNEDEGHDRDAREQRRLEAERARQHGEDQERREADGDAEPDPPHLFLDLRVFAACREELDQPRDDRDRVHEEVDEPQPRRAFLQRRRPRPHGVQQRDLRDEVGRRRRVQERDEPARGLRPREDEEQVEQKRREQGAEKVLGQPGRLPDPVARPHRCDHVDGEGGEAKRPEDPGDRAAFLRGREYPDQQIEEPDEREEEVRAVHANGRPPDFDAAHVAAREHDEAVRERLPRQALLGPAQ